MTDDTDGILRGINERKRDEEELTRHAALIDLSPDGIMARQLDGTITFWSRGAESLYGWTRQEAIGQQSHTLLQTQFLQPLEQIVEQIQQTGRWSGEIAHRTKDGRQVVVQSRWMAQFDEQGNLSEILESNVDITEGKLMEGTLREAYNHLEIRVKERTAELEDANRALQEEIAERKRAEEAVKAERQRFNDVLETLPAYLVLLTPDYHVPFANRFFRERFGESHGQRCFEYLFGRSEPCENCEAYTVLKTMAPHEWEWTGPDGRHYYIYDFTFTDTDGSTLILEMGLDITERKQTEIELERHREHLQELVRARTSELEAAKAHLETEITEHNQAEEDLRKTRDYLENLIDYANAPIIVWDPRFKITRFNHAFERLTGLVATIAQGQDITERKQAEEALRESERRWATTLASIGDAVIATDVDGRITFMNAVAEALTGWTPGETAGTPAGEVFNIINETTRRQVENPVAKVLREGMIVGLANHTILVRKDGTEMPIDDSGAPIRDQDGKTTGVVLVFCDITERKQAEKALQEKREELTAANEELQAQAGELNTAYKELREADRRKNEFLAVLSHELRNPLAAVHNSLHILDRAAPGGAQAKQAKEVIERQVGQLSHLVDDLLDITRITQNKIKLQRQRLDLNVLVQRTVDDHRTFFEKSGVSLESEYAPSTIFVHADGARLAQVVGNLLLNAAKFTRQGGSTRVSVAGDHVGRRAIIRVADTGVGIPPEMLPRLFQPFMQADTTLDRSRGGLGLGLALSKGLIELHGGDMSAHSDGNGKGSEFMVRLPLDETLTEEPRAARPEIPSRRRRVLIIEDHADLAESLRELLELDGHQVAVAYDGPEGLNRAREFRPEVLLCDIGLPGLDGCAVARAFRADEGLKGVFLVALTGYALPEDRRRTVEAGFDRHLAKPPDLAELERMLAQAPAGTSA